MNEIAARFNAARFYCVQRIRAVPRSHSPYNSFMHFALSGILYEIEGFVVDDFSSVDELSDVLTLAAEQVQTRLTSPTYHDHASLARDVCQGFIRSLHEIPNQSTPLVPYRRVLTKAEAKHIWRDFDNERLLLPKGTFVDDKLDLPARQAMLIGLGINTIFNISPASYAGYELDVSWLDEMYVGDDTYWTSKEWTWYIYTHGYGYPVVAGDLLRETEGEKAWSAYRDRQNAVYTAALQQKQQPEAAPLWPAVRARYADETSFLYDHVDAELKLGDLEEAERVAEQLRATPGGEGLGLYQLSFVRQAQGRTSEAIAFVTQAGQIAARENRGQLAMAVRTRIATLTQAEQ